MRDWMIAKRKEQRLTMKQVASAIGITEGYYSLIEKGERMAKLDIDFAKKIGDVFGMSIQEIADAEKGI